MTPSGSHSVKIQILALAVALLLVAPFTVQARHDGSWSGEIGGVGPEFTVFAPHQDADPFKGNFTVTVTNSGNQPWGDFHFGIYDPIGGQDISNVHFLDSTQGGQDPASSQSPLTWVIDNAVVGATIDLYFYSDPVLPGETAWFQVYTDNPDELPFFGVLFYPTPLPPPPLGACCFEDGHCELLTQAQCDAAPGHAVWLGEGTVCEPINPCSQPPPTGACCFLDGTCQVLIEVQCIELQGFLWMPNEDCVDDCPPVPTRNTTWGKIKATYR